MCQNFVIDYINGKLHSINKYYFNDTDKYKKTGINYI